MWTKFKRMLCKVLKCQEKMEVDVDYLNMDEESYMKHRVVDQINWYCSKSSTNKKLYYRFVLADIILSASIPFITLFVDKWEPSTYLIASIGSIVTIVSGVISTFQFQKKWIEYRTTSETLKHTQFLYSTNTAPYDRNDGFSIFVQNVESLISSENTNWAFYVQKNVRSEQEEENE